MDIEVIKVRKGEGKVTQGQEWEEVGVVEPEFWDNRLHLEEMKELGHLRMPNVVVPGMCMRESVGMLISEPHMGKSLLALDLAIAFSRGERWLGIPLPKVKVAYFGLDCPDWDMGLMAQSLMLGRGGEIGDLEGLWVMTRRIEQPFTLPDESSLREIVESVKFAEAKVVVFDCFSDTTMINENDRNEAVGVMASFQRIAAKTGAVVLITDHTPVIGREGVYAGRGSGAKSGRVDFIWHLTQAGAGKLVMRVEKSRGFNSKKREICYEVVNEEHAGCARGKTRLEVRSDTTVKERAEREGTVRKQILEMLRSGREVGVKEIIEKVEGVEGQVVRNTLSGMKREGMVKSVRTGVYVRKVGGDE